MMLLLARRKTALQVSGRGRTPIIAMVERLLQENVTGVTITGSHPGSQASFLACALRCAAVLCDICSPCDWGRTNYL